MANEPISLGREVVNAAEQVAQNCAGITVMRVLYELARRADQEGRAVITVADLLAVAAELGAQMEKQIDEMQARTRAIVE